MMQAALEGHAAATEGAPARAPAGVVPAARGAATAAAAAAGVVARYSEEGVLAGRADARSDADKLGDLLERGVGATFDLRAWAARARRCGGLAARARLALLLEPCRADVAKWIAMRALEKYDDGDDGDDARAGIREQFREQCVYAEITPASMDAIFDGEVAAAYDGGQTSLLPPPPSRAFYDLGSGTGKNVLLAAVAGRFDRAVGIEILPELSAIAGALGESFREDVAPGSSAVCDVEFRTASFLEDLEWVDAAGVVYCNTIMFDEPLMVALAAHARGMRPGALFITLGQDLLAYFDAGDGEPSTLEQDPFEIIGTFATRHSFGGGVDTFVHRRRGAD